MERNHTYSSFRSLLAIPVLKSVPFVSKGAVAPGVDSPGSSKADKIRNRRGWMPRWTESPTTRTALSSHRFESVSPLSLRRWFLASVPLRASLFTVATRASPAPKLPCVSKLAAVAIHRRISNSTRTRAHTHKRARAYEATHRHTQRPISPDATLARSTCHGFEISSVLSS